MATGRSNKLVGKAGKNAVANSSGRIHILSSFMMVTIVASSLCISCSKRDDQASIEPEVPYDPLGLTTIKEGQQLEQGQHVYQMLAVDRSCRFVSHDKVDIWEEGTNYASGYYTKRNMVHIWSSKDNTPPRFYAITPDGLVDEDRNIYYSLEKYNEISAHVQQIIHLKACLDNTRKIESAKEKTAMYRNDPDGTIYDGATLSSRIEGGYHSLKCPEGGTYTINGVGTISECNIPGHAMTPWLY